MTDGYEEHKKHIHEPLSARSNKHEVSSLRGNVFKGRPSRQMNSNTNGGRNNNKTKIFGGTVGTRNRHQGSPSNRHSKRDQTSNENDDGSKSENDHWPLTPAQAFKLYSNDLSDYEHGEILEYPEIYCTGAPDKKIRKNSGNNNGYDDDRGDYRVVINDHIGTYFIRQIAHAFNFPSVASNFLYHLKLMPNLVSLYVWVFCCTLQHIVMRSWAQ